MSCLYSRSDVRSRAFSFPPGVPHSIQALGTGLEILILFTDGNFDRSGTTFMLSDWLAHTPLEIVAQNLGLNVSQLGGIPQKDPYIIPATVPPPPLGQGGSSAPVSPEGTVPNPYVFKISEQKKTVAKGGGGWVKIQDSTNFKVRNPLQLLTFTYDFTSSGRFPKMSRVP